MINIPKGFKLAAANADFRGKKLARRDLCLALSDVPAVAAGVFTTNLFRAAPVLVSQKNLNGKNPVYGVLINSGQANACTGEQGMQNCLDSLAMVADALRSAGRDIAPDSLLPASTGVIGAHMNMKKWENANKIL